MAAYVPVDSSNFHIIQMHRNRPILYIALVIKCKTLLILKSKKRLSLQFVLIPNQERKQPYMCALDLFASFSDY
jgi:hypothetical protein